MAGVKGMRGGGGARPGAGRKPSEPTLLDIGPHRDPLDFLLSAMRDERLDMRLRIDAARSALPYLHERKGEAGKKQERQGAAKTAATGRFAPCPPPRLASVRPLK